MGARLPSLIAIPLLAALGACTNGAHSQPAEARTPATDEPPMQAAVAADEPSVDHMLSARRSGKATVPVDVRYLFVAPPAADQTATLQLAFIPRVAGQNLRVEFPASSSVAMESASTAPALALQKAEAQGIYRHALLVTPRTLDTEIRVLVSLDVAGGRYFGIFSIPVADTPAAEKNR